MKMDGEIRVKTVTRYGRLYNDMKIRLGGDFHEIFFACACLAYKRNQCKALGSAGSDRFWSKTITPREWSCYYAMTLKDGNMDFSGLHDDKKVISKMEGYANAGMDILIAEFLHDYLLVNAEEPQLDPASCKELPKTFLHFLFEQADENGDGNHP